MFPKGTRLPRAAFALRGWTSGSEHFRAIFHPGPGYAVVVSKKVARRSVDRHLLKRRVVGALQQPPAIPLPAGLILYPKASALGLSPEAMRQELALLITKGRS